MNLRIKTNRVLKQLPNTAFQVELRTRSSSLGGLELRVSFTLVWKLELTVNVEIRSKSQQHFNTTNLRVCTTGFTLIYKLTYLHKPIWMMSMLKSKKYVIYYIYTTVFRVKRLNNRTRRVRFFNRLTRIPWYEWFVTWSHAISHLGRWLLHGSMRVIKLQPRFKVCNISYLRVLFHSSYLAVTYILVYKQ